MIKGVKRAIISHIDTEDAPTGIESRLDAFDELTGSISFDKIDMDDERTRYLLGK